MSTRVGEVHDQIVGICEQTLGFEFSLLISAVKESFTALVDEEAGMAFATYADILQKRLKYGLPNQECVAYFEAGFSDRAVAQALSEGIIWGRAKSIYDVRRFAAEYPDDFAVVLRDFPAYFTDEFESMSVSRN